MNITVGKHMLTHLCITVSEHFYVF